MRARAAATIVGIVTVGYFALLLANTCYFAAGPDSSGYLNQARLLLSGRMAAPVASPPHLFTPYGFTAGTTPGTMVPTYPVGTSLHLALGAAIGGWRIAPFVMVPLAAVASLLLIAFIARRIGLSNGWAIVAAMLFAAFPMFIAQAVQPVSDVLATFWALATIACALRANEHWRWPLLCGIAFAIGVAVRPTNLLLAIALIVLLRSRAWIVAAAAVPFAIALAWYYAALYGSPFMTGYGGVGLILSFASIPPCFTEHVQWLFGMGTPLLIAGLFARTHRTLLLSWFGVFFVFYAYYSFCPDHSSARFLLPALPALIVGFVAVISRFPRPVAVALVLIVLGREIQQIGRLHVLHLNEWEAIYPRTVAWVDREVPRDAIVMSAITSGAFYFHSNRAVVRWDQLTPETSTMLRANPRFAKPWYAVVSEVEGGLAGLRARVPGQWVAVGKIRDVTVWRLETTATQ